MVHLSLIPITKRTLFRILKVKSIKDAGKSDVYDITVEDNHNFLVTENNILHNCEIGYATLF